MQLAQTEVVCSIETPLQGTVRPIIRCSTWFSPFCLLPPPDWILHTPEALHLLEILSQHSMLLHAPYNTPDSSAPKPSALQPPPILVH